MNSFATTLEEIIKNKVKEVMTSNGMGSPPSLPTELVATDNIGEVIEKLVILHIRTWMLEDLVGIAKTDEELGIIKKKIDICFKQKRPMYVEAINKMIDSAIQSNKSLREDSVKIYKSF